MAGTNDPQQPALELRVLERWRQRDVARRLLALRAGAPARAIWEHPAAVAEDPAADLPARVLADAFARYATMRGWQVDRRGVRDCHDPALEVAVERELGLGSKARIEDHGVGELTARCRDAALASAGELDALSERLGLGACAGEARRSLDAGHIESVWWAVKELAEQGLVRERLSAGPYCPRCETPLSPGEVAHRDVAARTAHVRFKVARDGGPLQAGDELLVWSPAPWTLVANAAVALDPELTYVRAKTGALDAPVVCAEALAERLLGSSPAVRVLARFPGAAIDGLRYEPPFHYFPSAAFGERAHTVLLAGFVTATEGTGLVSVAPAFGEDDLRLGERYGLAAINPVDAGGAFDARTGRYAGRSIADAEPALVDDLRARGRLLRADEHERPAAVCRHCATPLLAYAKASWHVATSRLRSDASRLLSRERFWGTPLPIWRCEQGHATFVGSFEELEQRSGRRLEHAHRPYADDVALTCDCGEQATRVPDLVAPWFEAGAMPFAASHEPFAGELTLDELYPADVVCAPPGQARQWPAALRTVSALLRGADPAFHDVVRAPAGEPAAGTGADVLRWQALAGEPAASTGADVLRWQALAGEPGEELVARLLSTYALAAAHPAAMATAEEADLDRWIRSRLHAAIDAARERLDAFDATAAAAALRAFADELCGCYTRGSHERLALGDGAARRTLRECLKTLAQLLAPFTPFLADEIYVGLGGSEPSVHLSDWPVAGPRDLELEAAIGLAHGV